jgi:hypothetical protein
MRIFKKTRKCRLLSVLLVLFSVATYHSHAQEMATFQSGAYIIDMGVVPQTINNALKPYGLIYSLIINNAVSVKWVIDPNKSKDGVDFTYNGYSFKGGPFIIPAEFRNKVVNDTIAKWQTMGVVGVTTTAPITVPVFKTLSISAVPRWTLDKQNGAIAKVFFQNAGIPASAYGGPTSSTWKNPADLGACDDIFVMPHADPVWSTHGNLYDWNLNHRGCIWLGCTAGSALEDMFNPSNPSQQTNFLSEKTGNAATSGSRYYNPYYENAMVLWTHHGNGTPPYIYDNGGDPVMQFLGNIDVATQQGAEQIYLPTNGGVSGSGGWRPTTKIGGYDPTVTGLVGSDAKYRAAVLAYGSAFGDSDRGMVMMEASHNIAKDVKPENVAAQRAFFNFSFLAGKVSAPQPEFSFQVGNLKSGEVVPVSFTVSAPRNINEFDIVWTSSSGGTFSPNNAASVEFTVPQVSAPTNCIISVTLTERTSCAKVYKGAVGASIVCALDVIPSVTPACYGQDNGSVSMTISGGDGNYVWNWTKTGSSSTASGTGTTISNLAAGTYAVTITSGGGAGCAKSFNITINQNTQLSATVVSAIDLTCNGVASGSIDVSVSGGSPAYSYAWTGPNGFTANTVNISSLLAGKYDLTVTDSKGCTNGLSVTLTQPSAISVSTSVTAANGYGATTGAISLTVSGGTGTMSYLWNDGSTAQNRTNLAAGSYSVVVTDANGCSKTISDINVTQPAALTLSASATSIACNGGTSTITISASGGTGTLLYSLNGGTFQSDSVFTNVSASPNPYILTVKDQNNYQGHAQITITQPDKIVLSANVTNASCPGQSDGSIALSISGGTPGYGYAWSGPNSYSSTTASPSNVPAGTYQVTVTDSKGCVATMSVVVTNQHPLPVLPGVITK